MGAILADTPTAIRTLRGIQQSFPMQARSLPSLIEPSGVVYTKRWVVELLLNLAGYDSKDNLVDAVAVEPAVGRGSFLEPMIERLVDACQRLGRPISDCRNSLVCHELDEASAEHARGVAKGVLESRGVNRATAAGLADEWVHTSDYLLDSMSREADFVLGNPPYIRLEEIPEEAATIYRSAYGTMRGRADLYVAFFEAALRQLKDRGVCAFICADRWMRNQYGADLRELISSELSVDVVISMHNANAFNDEVDAYPAITVISRRKQGRAIVASADRGLEGIPSATLNSSLLGTAGGAPVAWSGALRVAQLDTWFKGGEPWPCDSPEQLALLRRLEDQFPALEVNAG